MTLKNELGFITPFKNRAHETLLNIVITGALLVKEGQHILKPLGLTDAQFNILMLLKYQSDKGRINQTKIGRMLLVNRSNVTGLIDRMEKAALVRRTADVGDRRVHMIEMTGKGRDLLDRSERVYYKRIEEVMSHLSSEQLDQLIQNLETARERLKV